MKARNFDCCDLQDKLGLNLYILDAVTGHLIHQSLRLKVFSYTVRLVFSASEAEPEICGSPKSRPSGRWSVAGAPDCLALKRARVLFSRGLYRSKLTND